MRHLTSLEIETLNGNESLPAAVREHFAQCEACRARAADAQNLERALSQMTRAEPAADLSARIIAALPRQARQEPTNGWLGAATLIAALIGFALAYQSAFLLRANGVFELVSYYTTQPEIVTMYPNEALGALAVAIPWMTVAISLVMLAVALGLTFRWTGRPARAAG